MDLFEEEKENRPGFLSRLASTIYLIINVICCLSFDVSIVTPLNDSKVFMDLSRFKGVNGNVIAE